MTMHLARGLSMTSTKKPKPNKLTKIQLAQYEKDLKEYNARMKRAGRHRDCMSLSKYIDYRHGITSERARVTTGNYTPSTVYRRGDTSHIKSLDTGIGVAPLPEKKEYTGTLIKGIAQTHKSNAVPVIDEEHIKDIARMRR